MMATTNISEEEESLSISEDATKKQVTFSGDTEAEVSNDETEEEEHVSVSKEDIYARAFKLADEKKRQETPLQQWRRMARLVRILVGVCIALRKYAMEAGLMENYLVAVQARKTTTEGEDGDVQELTFNVRDFKVTQELKVPKQLIEVLEKKPEWRTTEEIHAISRLMRSLPSFRKYTHDMQLLMSKIVRYMKCGKRRVVLRKGHIGYSVYFIYSGQVSVVLDTDEQNVFVKPETVVLRKGACFGEIALVQNTRRNATVVCSDETEFLVVDKDDFVENGLNSQTEEETSERKAFLRSWGPLASWSINDVSALTYMSRTEDFNHNKVVITDSRNNEWLWFVIKGSCEVLRLVDLSKSSSYQRLVNLHSYSKSRYIATTPSVCARAQSAPAIVRNGSRRQRPQTSMGVVREETLEEEEDEEEGSSGSTASTFGSGGLSPRPNEGENLKRLQETVRLIMTGKHLVKSRREKVDEEVQTGIYVKVDTLRDGECFGLDSLFDDLDQPNPPRFSLVSKGCTVVHFPRAKFKDMSDDVTLEAVRQLVKQYPSDAELCEGFLSKSEWDYYKHGLVESVVTDIQTNITFENSLRNCQQPEYGVRFDVDRMTQRFYTPLTSRTKNPLIGSYTVRREDVSKLHSPGLKSAIESRRPKTAATTRATPRGRHRNAQSFPMIPRNMTSSSDIASSSNSGHHKQWAARMKEYTTPSPAPSQPKSGLFPLGPASNPILSRPKSPNVLRLPTQPPPSELECDSHNKQKNHVIIVSTKPVCMDRKRDRKRRPSPVLAQTSKC